MSEQGKVREVMFSPPSEPPNIYWMHGHVPIEKFLAFHGEIEGVAHPPTPSQVKHGWGTRKLSGITMYLSDVAQENYEPITYWIPSDHQGGPAIKALRESSGVKRWREQPAQVQA